MSRKKSERRAEMFRLLKIKPMTCFEMWEATGFDLLYVRQEMYRMLARGNVKLTNEMRAYKGKRSTVVFAFLDEDVPPPPARAPVHIIKRKPRARTNSGSGQFPTPCISRSYKWNSGVPW